jgi:hypothetical protein
MELAFSRHEFAGMERLSPPPTKLATVTLAALLKDLRFLDTVAIGPYDYSERSFAARTDHP